MCNVCLWIHYICVMYVIYICMCVFLWSIDHHVTLSCCSLLLLISSITSFFSFLLFPSSFLIFLWLPDMNQPFTFSVLILISFNIRFLHKFLFRCFSWNISICFCHYEMSWFVFILCLNRVRKSSGWVFINIVSDLFNTF